MKGIIKAFFWPLVAILIFVMLLVAIKVDKEKTISPQKVEQVNVGNLRQFLSDSIRSESTKEKIRLKDSLILQFEARLLENQKGRDVIRAQNKHLKQENDTLRRKYEKNPTLTACDSVVRSQSKLIDGLCLEIDSLDSETEIYSRLNNELKTKCSLKDTIIESKLKLIESQKQTIESLNCAHQWGFKHKFWKWVFRWKCN